MIKAILAWTLNAYFHWLPEFRGKWRLLVPFAPMLDGTPVRSRYGVMLGLDLHDRTNHLGVLGRYGNTVSGEVEKLRKGDCFIDVGANCGIFSLLAARKVGASGLVIAFEPCFDTFAKLVRNIQMNAQGNVLPLNMAVAEMTRPDLLDNGSKGHSGRYAIANAPVEGGEMVMSASLSDFPGLMQLIGDRATLVKIDVEGFEHAVLQGLMPVLSHPNTRSVVVEIDERNLGRYGASSEQVFALLAAHGFRRTDPTGGLAHFDAVFLRDASTAVSTTIAASAGAWNRRHDRKWVPPRPRRVAPKVAAAALLFTVGWIATQQAGLLSHPALKSG